MSRKIIITPYELGGLDAFNKVLNFPELKGDLPQIDVPHIFFSAITISGVDKILSFDFPKDSNTKLIKGLVTVSDKEKWHSAIEKVNELMAYYHPNIDKKNYSRAAYRLSNLLFAMETKSSILQIFKDELFGNLDNLNPEIAVPINAIEKSVQIVNSKLPVLKYDINKIDIERLFKVLESKEFGFYKEAHNEISLNNNLTTNTIKRIEKAGKDLYESNSSIMNIKDSMINSIPLTSKVIEVFFGKLPSIFMELFSKILTDYLKENKSLAVYDCRNILEDQLKRRINTNANKT
ncbi:hypothetical protein [Rufibacter psychrotolerans]|uniref:hypothetical protein n=1 Tax=Rufibacter psychrotolerans TaxID=2812556 RepID=UPI0019688266|nr:hypothetical protein [Rufibacter sp. SYSU D00308]